MDKRQNSPMAKFIVGDETGKFLLTKESLYFT